MSLTTAAAIYFVIWWVVLFTVLPFGVRNPSEAGETVEPGNDPGAPTVPALGRSWSGPRSSPASSSRSAGWPMSTGW